MIDELTSLLNIAIDREIVSQAFYIAGQKKTEDPGAIELMKELAQEELNHYQWIRDFKEKGPTVKDWHPKRIQDLRISEYLADTNLSEGVGLQEVITAAIKREQYSMQFYSDMRQAVKNESARQLCARLVHEELNHKMKLETFYDDLFYQEN